MVTHDQRYAAHADRSVHLFDGRVIEEGELKERALAMH
jgi:putative ABC transport system ATP-binding protein